MYLQTDPVAWAKADRAEGVLSLAAEHSSNATGTDDFKPRLANLSLRVSFAWSASAANFPTAGSWSQKRNWH